MADKRDYYEVLGIQKGADADAIKKAYRQKAKEYHPDLHPDMKDATERMQEVNEAYEVLSDAEKKSRYDQFGHAGVDPSYGAGAAGGGGAGFSGFDGFGGVDLGDIFGDLFGFGGSRSTARSANAPQRGDRVTVGVTVSFEEAAFGCERDIDVSRVEECDTCHGSGAEPGTKSETCDQCHGSGVVTRATRTAFGVMQTQSACPKCGGKGKIIEKPCQKCRGLGKIRRRRTMRGTIPAGIDDGMSVVRRGEGNAGENGGGAGDLYITVRVKPHEVFGRDGTTVLMNLDVSMPQAALGGEIQVPTIDGTVKYKLPEGTQTGSKFRLRGAGITDVHNGGRGDQIVTVNVLTPTKLSSEQKELMQKLADSMGVANVGNAKKKKKK